jgi:hypothetical protein
MNDTVHVETVAEILTKVTGEVPVDQPGLDVEVSFAPCPWAGIVDPAELE